MCVRPEILDSKVRIQVGFRRCQPAVRKRLRESCLFVSTEAKYRLIIFLVMIKLGYWSIRGMAQPIRFVLEYTGISWQDVLYHQAGPTAPIPFDKSCWFDKKSSLDMPFPNLPYLEDESRGIRISQSQAVLRYVCKLSPDLHLLGRDLASETAIDVILAEFADCKVLIVSVVHFNDNVSYFKSRRVR